MGAAHMNRFVLIADTENFEREMCAGGRLVKREVKTIDTSLWESE